MRFLIFLAICATASAGVLKAVEEPIHYDQRQNGTENYRVSVDGVLVAIAPADALLQADISDFLELIDYPDSEASPKPPATNATSATPPKIVNLESQRNDEKPKKKGLKRRIADFLIPLLRRNRHN